MKFNVTVPTTEYKIPSFTQPGNYKYILEFSKKNSTKFHQIFKVTSFFTVVKT